MGRGSSASDSVSVLEEVAKWPPVEMTGLSHDIASRVVRLRAHLLCKDNGEVESGQVHV